MLISQRIVKYPDFLTAVVATGLKPVNIETRMEFVHCIKVIVPAEMLNVDGGVPESILGVLKGGYDTYIKHVSRYVQYVRLPYPDMLFENETGAVRVQDIPDGWRITTIHKTGQILGVHLEVFLNDSNGPPRIEIIINKYLGITSMTDDERTTCQMLVMQICEVLMFMNAVNIKTHVYSLNKKEINNFPKNLLPFYTYKILDIFRERKEYVSLKDIENTLLANKAHAVVRRGHMVKGHWKAKKNGLFWWSSFMRCRKNIKDVGIIEKDYNLVLS